MRPLDGRQMFFTLVGILIIFLMTGRSYAATEKMIHIQVSIEFKDSDGDGIPDSMESVVHGTDPNNPDSDGDGYNDGDEIHSGSDPLNPSSRPVIFNIPLQKGFNLISAPANTDSIPDVYTFLGIIDNSGTIVEKIGTYDMASGLVKEAYYNQDGSMGGDNFPITAGNGLIIYMKDNILIELSQHQCPVFDLKTGTNWVGTPCQPSYISAFSLLLSIGDKTVVSSIQRFNRTTGLFETAAYDQNSQPVGADFSIEPGEGYFIYMNQDKPGFRP